MKTDLINDSKTIPIKEMVIHTSQFKCNENKGCNRMIFLASKRPEDISMRMKFVHAVMI